MNELLNYFFMYRELKCSEFTCNSVLAKKVTVNSNPTLSLVSSLCISHKINRIVLCLSLHVFGL